MAPNGGSEKEYLADVAADTIYSPAHGYADTSKIVFYRGTVPAGLASRRLCSGTAGKIRRPRPSLVIAS